MQKLDEYRDNLGFLQGTERLEYLIDLARKPTTLPEILRTEDRLVTGCMSKIWIDVGLVEDLVQVYYDSDAMITKGITSIVCECYSNLPLKESLKITQDDIHSLGIAELVTQQRRNGLSSLVGTIRKRLNALEKSND